MMIEITDTGQNNQVDIAQDVTRTGNMRIVLQGNHNHLVIGAGSKLASGILEIRNSNSALEIGANCLINGQLRLRAHDTRLEIGDETTMMGAQISLHEAGRITLGRDCMLSGNIVMDVSDMHSILDAKTGQRINPPQDIVIKDHVWIAQGVQVMKGAMIGHDCMIGAKSLVLGEIPDGSLAVGIPAKVLRAGITWDRRRLPWDGSETGARVLVNAPSRTD